MSVVRHPRNDSLVLSVDPGKNIGVASWLPTGHLVGQTIVDFDTLDDYLEMTTGIEVIVYEDYRTNPWKKQGGSKQDASQVIGMLRSHARRRGIEVVVQPNTILRVAALHSHTAIPARGHIKDDVSAYLHGFYYFTSQGIPAYEMRKRNGL